MTNDDEPNLPAPVRRAAIVGAALAMLVFGWLISGGRLAGLFEEGPATARIYDAQARALLHGRLDLPPEVTGVEGFEVDGENHVYFGIFPAVLRLPVIAMTDALDGQLTVASMLVALALLMWATARLCWDARAAVQARRDVGGSDDSPEDRWAAPIVGTYVFAVGAASPVVALAVRPAIYLESSMWALAATVWTMVLVVALWQRRSWRDFFLASLAATAALGSRASIGAVALLALAAVVARWFPALGWRRCSAMVAMALLPLVAYAAVNQARFGSPYSIPWEDQVYSALDAGRQDALRDTDGRLMGPQYIPTAAVHYLRPDALRPTTLFPFVRTHPVRTVGDVSLDIVEPTASLPTVAPALCVGALAGLWALARRATSSVWVVLAGASAAGLAGVLTIASVANRYLGDFVPLLVVTSAIGLWWVRDRLRDRTGWPVRLAAVIGLALTLVGCATGSAVTLMTQRLHFFASQESVASFVTMQYEIHDRFFGGPPPGVVMADVLPDPADAAVGDVVILPDCSGVYWLSERGWTYVERGPGRQFELAGAIDADETVLLTTGEWVLVARSLGIGGIELAVGDPAAPSPIAEVEMPDGEVRLSVTVDPVGGVLQVRRAGRLIVDKYGLPIPRGDELHPGRYWSARPVETPLCDRLVAALG